MIYLILLLVVLLPIAWLASEFQERRAIRIALGMLSIGLSIISASAYYGTVDRIAYNTWYGSATADLIDTMITEIETGDCAKLLTELKQFEKKFEPTYENRAHYDELVREFVAHMEAVPNAVPEKESK
jgi:hypothetical protein